MANCDVKNLLIKALPGLAEGLVLEITEYLKSDEIGVEKVEDMKYITLMDLNKTPLKPIQSRRLLDYINCSSEKDLDISTDEMASNSSTATVSEKTNVGTWCENYIPRLEIFNKQTQAKLTGAVKLSPKFRNIVVRTLVDDAIKHCSRPSRGDMRKVASKFVTSFPFAIKDEIDGEVIGSGFYSFEVQLITRLENLSREREQVMPRMKEIKKKKTHLVDLMAKSDFKFNPDISDLDYKKCEEIRENLIKMSKEMEPNSNVVEAKMLQSYVLQRMDLNNGRKIEEIIKLWPFLFETSGMKIHITELLGKNVFLLFENFFTKRSNIFCLFFAKSTKEICKKSMEKLKEKREDKMVVGTIISLIMNHFKENPEIIFPVFEPGTPEETVETKLPLHPCLVVYGESLPEAVGLMLASDGKIVNNHVDVKKLGTALAMLFSTYFIQNVCYPEGVISTMEFFQRFIAKINKNKKDNVHPKVIGFINKVSELDWTESQD